MVCPTPRHLASSPSYMKTVRETLPFACAACCVRFDQWFHCTPMRRLLNPLLILFTVGIACHLSMPNSCDQASKIFCWVATMARSAARGRRADRTVSSASFPDSGAQQSGSKCMAFKTRADIGRAWPSAPARRPYNSGGPAMSQPPSRMNAIGFSTYTGGFYDVDRTPNERVVSVDGGQNALVVRTSSRTLVLKSQSTGWTEVR